MRIWLFLFLILITCISASASDVNILTYRTDYRPLETFQAEIILDKEPANDITNLNFELYKDKPIGVLLFLEKLSDKRYFVYFDIPQVENGEYNFRVKNINVIDNWVLRRLSDEKTININDINPGFNYLINNQNNDGNFGDITKTSLSALALKNVDNNKASLSISYLINNQDATGCFPKGNCNVKDTSFVLLALGKFDQNYIKTKNWLKDASNNFELGIWKLRLEGNAICGNIQLNGVYDLNVNNKEINVTCNNPVSFTLTHTYLGNTYTIYEYSGNNFTYAIDDSGCYGIKYKDKCDYISTLYASWALKSINEEFPENYLKQNRLDNRTMDHALGYILYNDDYDKEWLLNNYLNGYWSYYSASISQQPDNFVSALATHALRDEFLFQESKDYLKDKTNINILDSTMILYLLFDNERKMPSISIIPGIANKKDSFILKIKNNREPINILIESQNFTNIPDRIYLDKEASYNINAKESFDITINYDNYSYVIPVISKDKVIDEESPLLPPPKNAIKFINEDVNITLNTDDMLSDDLKFINTWNFKLDKVSLNITGRLKEILEFDQDYFDSINSNETLSTIIYLNRDKNPKYDYYEGYLIVTSPHKTLDTAKFSVKFSGELNIENGQDNTNQNEEKIIQNESESNNGKIIKPAEKKKSLWWIWLIIIFFVGIIVFLFLRRKKEVTQSFESYAKNIKK